MNSKLNLAEARKNLPDLADRAYGGQVFVLARRGRELAVVMGIDEYRRLKALEQEQRERDFDLLAAPPDVESLSEDEARKLAVQTVKEVRESKRAARTVTKPV
jgi:prevent-host-death family protein